MKLRETVYHVRDLDAALEHYCNVLGGKLVSRLPWGVAFVDIDGQGGIISLFDLQTYRNENPHREDFPGPKVVISVDDVPSFRSELLLAGVNVGGILGEQGDLCGFEAFDGDGNAIFYLEDPSGDFDDRLRSDL